MEIDFGELMTSKTKEELREYIDNRLRYNPVAVLEAIKELERKGEIFSTSEIETIKFDLENQRKISLKRIEDSKFGFYKWLEKFEMPKSEKKSVRNKFNKLAFIISLIYVGLGTIAIYGMYYNSGWPFLLFLITLPVSAFGFAYRFTANPQNHFIFFIIQSIMLIPTFFIVRVFLEAREQRKNKP